MTPPNLEARHPDKVTFLSHRRWPPPEWVHADDYRELWEIARRYEKIILKDAPLVKEAIAARIEAREKAQ